MLRSSSVSGTQFCLCQVTPVDEVLQKHPKNALQVWHFETAAHPQFSSTYIHFSICPRACADTCLKKHLGKGLFYILGFLTCMSIKYNMNIYYARCLSLCMGCLSFWLSGEISDWAPLWIGTSSLPPVLWLTVSSNHDQTEERGFPALQPWLGPASLKVSW